MKLITDQITLEELQTMSNKMFNNLVRAVVDIEKEIMVVDADMHSDQEEFLLEHDSQQDNLWEINIHPDASDENFIEFDSMINLRPSSHNSSRYVENSEIRKKIIAIVTRLIEK